MVADVFADSDLYFGAVNCWTPQGECYKQFGHDQSSGEAKLKEQVENESSVIYVLIVENIFFTATL